MRYQLQHYYDVTPNTRDGAVGTLSNLIIIDDDFNGNNGSGYLWEEAEAEGFDSNAKYCLSIAEKENTPREMIEKFISLWMGRDYYYQDYDLGILVEDDKLFLSLAYMTE